MTVRDITVAAITILVTYLSYVALHYRELRHKERAARSKVDAMAYVLSQQLNTSLASDAHKDTILYSAVSQSINPVLDKDSLEQVGAYISNNIAVHQTAFFPTFNHLRFRCYSLDSVDYINFDYQLLPPYKLTVSSVAGMESQFQERGQRFCDSLDSVLLPVRPSSISITRYWQDEYHQRIVADGGVTVSLPYAVDDKYRLDSVYRFNKAIAKAFVRQVLKDTSFFKLVHVATKDQCGAGTPINECEDAVVWKNAYHVAGP